jgi:hypothetical protein
MRDDPRTGRLQAAGAACFVAGVGGIGLAVFTGVTNPTLNVLANTNAEVFLLALWALTIWGGYAMAGLVFSPPLPGLGGAEKPRSAWWLGLPIVVLIIGFEEIIRRSWLARQSNATPSFSQIVSGLGTWPFYVAFLVVLIFLYWLFMRKIAGPMMTTHGTTQAIVSGLKTQLEQEQQKNRELRTESEVAKEQLAAALECAQQDKTPPTKPPQPVLKTQVTELAKEFGLFVMRRFANQRHVNREWTKLAERAELAKEHLNRYDLSPDGGWAELTPQNRVVFAQQLTRSTVGLDGTEPGYPEKPNKPETK